MAELLSLPEHVLELIVARTARCLSRYETSWGGAALTCKRLHDLQLPGEYAVIKDLQSLPWLLPRLKHAKALQVDTQRSTYGTVTRIRPLRETITQLLNASSNLAELRVLVLRVMSNDDRLVRPLVPWIFELLLGASSLHTLEFNVWNIPCPPILRRLPLKHLKLTVRSVEELLDVLEDLGYCRILESLCITSFRDSLKIPFPELPPVDLSTATKLRHVQLIGFIPGASQMLSLPPGCALSLVGYSKPIELWSKHWVTGRDIVKALSVFHTGTVNQELPDPVMYAWPKGLECFPALQHLQLDCVKMAEALDLSVFAKIPCLKICSKQRLAVRIRKGSWRLLELEGPHKFRMHIADLHSFLRSTSVFVFTLPSGNTRTRLVEQLTGACRFSGVPLYEEQHKVAVESSTVNAVHCYRQLTRLSNDQRYVHSTSLDSSAMMGTWPADPIASATDRLKMVS